MELFFNLLWVLLSSLLVGFWLRRRDRWTDESLRSSVAVQFVALALLIVILLPVVSLTDDLQACTVPTESEHLSRRIDVQVVADFALHAISLATAGLIFFQVSPQLPLWAWLSLPIERETLCAEYLRTLGIRPPPAV